MFIWEEDLLLTNLHLFKEKCILKKNGTYLKESNCLKPKGAFVSNPASFE